MKKFFKSLNRQDGFTLVELMVVVAIIGLLSAVAIPNFKKYQAKAKMSEAKLQLSALYTAETAFFSDYNMYGACLRYMGYDPDLERNNRYYAIGFPSGGTARDGVAHTAAVNSGMLATDCPQATAAVDGTNNLANSASYFLANKGIGGTVANAVGAMTGNAAGAATGVGAQAAPASMTFTAAAVGYISADALTPAAASGLTMDNTKLLVTRVNGF